MLIPVNGNCAATQLEFDDCRPFVTLAFKNGLEYWNYDFSILTVITSLPHMKFW